ncbi:hypothetical protein FRC10_011312 [Ceratobasidium sp. 414]|nr:hypothetical protein FRC10_011312 [Ceratobasidium sp. 414]
MFNSVEFVLMFLSMFSSVTKESIQAVTLLLHLAFQYNIGNVRGVDFHEYEFTMAAIEPLSALAESCGYDMKKINKVEMSKMPAELGEISKTGSSGSEVLALPLDEVRTLVKMWTQHARDDEEKHGWFGALPALGSVEYTTSGAPADTRGTFMNDDCGPASGSNQAVKHGPDEAPRSEKLGRWSKVRMDAKTAAIILAYCNEHAAVPAKTTLRRNGRVGKRQINPGGMWRDKTMEESGMWEMVHEVPTEGEDLIFYPSAAVSSRLGVGFSPSGRTQGFYRDPRYRFGPGVSSNEAHGWGDDGMECDWSMQRGGGQGSIAQISVFGVWFLRSVSTGGESLLQEPLSMQRSQNRPTFGSPLFAVSETSRSRAPPPSVPKAARRDGPVNVDDIFGVGFQNTHQARGTVPASNYDSGDVAMPRTPLKHDRSGFDYGPWGEHSSGSLRQVDNQGGRLDTPGSVANDYGFGEATIPRTPLKHDRGEFDYELWGGPSFDSPGGASHQGGSSDRPGPSNEMSRLDSSSVAGPSTSTPAPAAAAYGFGDLAMPRTPLKHNRDGFDYGLWGGHSVASFNQASTPMPAVTTNSGQTNVPSHHFSMSGVEPQPRGSTYDSGNMAMPKTPLKHDRGTTFDHGLWGEPSARETQLSYESGSTRIPRTPPNRNRGAFGYGAWVGRPTTSIDETSYQEERPTGPRPAMDKLRLDSTTRPRAPTSLRRVWRRRIGVRNLRAVAAAHAAMEDEDGMGPTTSMLNNALLAQREDDASCNLSDSGEELVNSWPALPPLVGYHELSREYCNRNGGSDTSLTASDSPSLLTPGTSSFPTPRTSPCPTLTMGYYAGVAAGWEAMQREKWQSGLRDEQSDVMVEPKWNMVAKVMIVAGRRLRGLLWN